MQKLNQSFTIHPVIIAGGHGTRLWPLSRERFPKQFQKIIGEENSLLQVTLKRISDSDLPKGDPILLCNKEHRFLVAEQLQEHNVRASIILEPAPRNTAPAIAVGALHLLEKDPDAVMLVMPADHWITDTTAFISAIKSASIAASQGQIVTFGIKPTAPETGYGYIEYNPAESDELVHKLLRFVEKPTLSVAQEYVKLGGYLWNAGIFCLRADTYIDALERYQPEALSAARDSYLNATCDNDFIRLDEAAFMRSPAISIDYAVMEKLTQEDSTAASVIPVDMGWNDLGSWSTIWQVENKDEQNNVAYGDVILQDTKECYVRAEHRLVSVIGMKECVIVETSDAVLVVSKDQVQDIKEMVEGLKKKARIEHAEHLTVRRPWGAYTSIDASSRYQVKRITVKPGASLSLQKHHHRAEHWIVVKGTAQVTRDDEVFSLHENESTYIPIGSVHRLKNPGVIPLELIEVQSGSYLGEDDIIRYEDQYSRVVSELNAL